MIDCEYAALQRIVTSRIFARSERHRRFLEWTVERGMQGRSHEIKESVLGVEIFGRKAGYDTQADPIVRVEVARLRAKLNRYYETEGRDEDIVLQYPKGAYQPIFERRAAAEIEALPEAPDHATGLPPETPNPPWKSIALAAIAVALMAMAAAVIRSAPPVCGPLPKTLDSSAPQRALSRQP